MSIMDAWVIACEPDRAYKDHHKSACRPRVGWKIMVGGKEVSMSFWAHGYTRTVCWWEKDGDGRANYLAPTAEVEVEYDNQ